MHRSACGILSISLLLALATSVRAQDAATPASASVVHCGHLFESTSGRLLGETSILVRGERIESVQSGSMPLPAGAVVWQAGRAVGE